MRLVAGLCLAAITLAACNKAPDQAETAAPPAARPVPPGIDAAPHLKAGLWAITNAAVPGEARTCVDDRSQSESAVIGQGLDRRNCSKSDWKAVPGGAAFDFVCENDGATLTSKGAITGDFNSAYRIDGEASMTINGEARTAKTSIEARYMGPCPADLQPGDSQITMNGKTFTVPGRKPG